MIDINPNQILPPDIGQAASSLRVGEERVTVRHLVTGDYSVPYRYSSAAPCWEPSTLRRMIRAEALGGAS